MPNEMPLARGNHARQPVFKSAQRLIVMSGIWRFTGDEASVLHGAASVGIENRVESIKKQRRFMTDERSDPPDTRTAHPIATNFPSAADPRRPIKTMVHAQTGLTHPLRVVIRRAQRRTKESFANIMHLTGVRSIRRVAGQPGANRHRSARL